MKRTLLFLLAACGSAGEGQLDVRVYGEAFIEEGIPAAAFHDGWRVEFDRFLVVVGEVSAVKGHDGPTLSSPAYKVYDLARATNGAGAPIASQAVEAGAYDHVGYRIAPSPDATLGTGTAADLALMKDQGYSIYVEGRGIPAAGDPVAFAWGFTTRTRYGHCAGTAVVEESDIAATVLTVHGDHLFYDDLFAAEPSVAFQLIADSDTNDDGQVTMAELLAKDLRPEAAYQVGSTGIENLGDFIAYQTGSLGHIDGEGHCEETFRE